MNPKIYHCACGNATQRLKHGEAVCDRCNELENMNHRWVNPPLDDYAISIRDAMAARKRYRKARTEPEPTPGPRGLLIVGYGAYAF